MFNDLQLSRFVKLIIGVCVVGFIIVVLSACSGHASFKSKPVNTNTPVMVNKPAPSSQSSTPIAQPKVLTLKQIDAQVGCVNFKNLGGGTDDIVKDSGSCWIGHDKYGSNSFPSKAARDIWLGMAKPYGVTPKWMTSTSVIYPSVPGA
jgi:hypothetical protein